MWLQGFLAPFLPTAFSFFFSSQVLLSSRQLCSLGISLSLGKSTGISQIEVGGGVVFSADYSASSQLLISTLG